LKAVDAKASNTCIGTPFGSCNELDQRIGEEMSDFNGKDDISNGSFSNEVSEAYLSTGVCFTRSEHPATVRVFMSTRPSSRRGLLGIFETAGHRNSPRELHNKRLISAAQMRLDRSANGAELGDNVAFAVSIGGKADMVYCRANVGF
jgi:hypothetical protein